MTIEAVVYIHGVSGHPQTSHAAEYEAMQRGIRRRRPDWPGDYCGVEWGWHPRGSPEPSSHELLTDAQEVLGRRALEAVRSSWDFTLNPFRLAVNGFRPFLIHNLADMFYYVSTEGKAAVRGAAAGQIAAFLRPRLEAEPAAAVSLTLLGHSAGSVIAFDFLFYLFYPERSLADYIDPAKANAAARLSAGDLERLRGMAREGRLRVRRLITFGSPIAPLAFRSDAVLRILAGGGRIDPSFHGLTGNPEAFEPLSGPRWINIWDKDDPIAWPVEPLMVGAGDAVADVNLDVSDLVSRAHTAYWRSSRVHAAIARRW